NALVVHLAPDCGVGNVAERREVDARNEISTGSGEDYDRVRPILSDAVERVDKLGVISCGERQGATVAVELRDQHALSITSHLQAAVGGEVIRLSRRHRYLPARSVRTYARVELTWIPVVRASLRCRRRRWVTSEAGSCGFDGEDGVS